MLDDIWSGVEELYNQLQKNTNQPYTPALGVTCNTSQSYFNDPIIDSFVDNNRLVIVKESSKVRDYAKGAKALVTQVVDGDTITIKFSDNICARVRLLGIDCPEINYGTTESTKKPNRAYCYGPQALKRTTKLLLNKPIYVNFDLNPFDRYKRLLLTVYTDQKQCIQQAFYPEDMGREALRASFNYQLVRHGFAKSCIYPDNPTFIDIFKEAEKLAKDNNMGAWSVCPNPFVE